MLFPEKVIFLISILFHYALCINYDDDVLLDILQNNGLSTLELTKKYGYPLEVHELTTQDGYIIELHRIPHGIVKDKKDKKTNRPAILLAPGLDMGSSGFMLSGNSSLAFILANEGYDVWIYCTRGTASSRKHVSLSPESKEFWMFSWNEIGYYDYPACIDYIINKTHQPKIFFMGYSQGATAFGVFASERPEYNDKLKLVILMASSIYTKHNKHPLWMHMSNNYDTIKSFFETLGVYEIPSGSYRGQWCNTMKLICLQIVYIVSGYGPQTHPDIIPVFVNNLSGGFPTRILEHYGQIFRERKFQKLDFGKSENLIVYGTETPPSYNISKTTAPVALFCGRNDPFVTCEDVDDLAKDFQNVVLKYAVPDEMWTHTDFIYGREAPELVYKVLLKLLNEF